MPFLPDLALRGAMAADAFWLILALAVGSAIVDWINKRRQKAEGKPEPVPPPVRRTSPVPVSPQGKRKLSRWEEELQELLKSLPAEEPPAPPPLPPPVRVPPPRPVPPPARVSTSAPLPAPTTARRPAPDESALPTPLAVPLVHSQAAMERAGQLHEEIARQLRRIDELTAQHQVGSAAGRYRVVPPHVSAAVTLLRDPRTIRQAIVASLILGPPKALADD